MESTLPTEVGEFFIQYMEENIHKHHLLLQKREKLVHLMCIISIKIYVRIQLPFSTLINKFVRTKINHVRYTKTCQRNVDNLLKINLCPRFLIFKACLTLTF